MIASLRNAFNAQFTEEKYAGMLADINAQFDYTPQFKISETPVFIPKELKKNRSIFSRNLWAGCTANIMKAFRKIFRNILMD